MDSEDKIIADETQLSEENIPVQAEQEKLDTVEQEQMSFADFGFKPEIMQGIDEAGFTEPTPIQCKAIPEVLAGHDLIGQALTGTGKTAAFGLPVMNMIAGTKGLRFLVLVPTRELAAQVSGELFKLGRNAGIHTAAFTGGQSYTKQEKMLDAGIDALVATPGRLIDLIESGHFDNINPDFIVVDEADEMLDMGFIEDIRKIFDHFPGPRQTMLFSATMPRPVVELAEKILNNPVEITTAPKETANNDIEQFFFVIEDRERTDAIVRLIDAQDVGKAMIFCRTKEETDSLNILLGGRGYNVNCLHGDMEQAQRSRVMGAFRRSEIDILVATDIAARGLDVDDVTHVFNFHLPFDSRGYVHRIGRTGRAGKTGTAITLVTPRELRQLEFIRKNVGAQIENRLIPTRTEVTSLRLKKLFHDIHDAKLDMDMLNQIQTLTVNQDIMVILAKLITRHLSGGADQGPEHIGIEGQRLTNLLSPKPRERRGRGERGERRGRGERGERVERGERKERRKRDRDDFDYSRTPPEERSIYEVAPAPKETAKAPIVREQDDFSASAAVVSENDSWYADVKPGRKRRERKDDFSFGGDERPKRRERKDDFGFGGDERPKRRERKDDFSFGGDERPKRREHKDDFSFGGDERPKRREHDRKKDFAQEAGGGRRSRRHESSGSDFGASFRSGIGKPARKPSGAKKGDTFNRHDSAKPGKKSGKGPKSWYL